MLLEETNEELPNFTISFEDGFGGLLQGSESNESCCKNFEVNLRIFFLQFMATN